MTYPTVEQLDDGFVAARFPCCDGTGPPHVDSDGGRRRARADYLDHDCEKGDSTT